MAHHPGLVMRACAWTREMQLWAKLAGAYDSKPTGRSLHSSCLGNPDKLCSHSMLQQPGLSLTPAGMVDARLACRKNQEDVHPNTEHLSSLENSGVRSDTKPEKPTVPEAGDQEDIEFGLD